MVDSWAQRLPAVRRVRSSTTRTNASRRARLDGACTSFGSSATHAPLTFTLRIPRLARRPAQEKHSLLIENEAGHRCPSRAAASRELDDRLVTIEAAGLARARWRDSNGRWTRPSPHDVARVNGGRTFWIPSLRNTSSKPAVNLWSRSRIRKRNASGSPAGPSSLDDSDLPVVMEPILEATLSLSRRTGAADRRPARTARQSSGR